MTKCALEGAWIKSQAMPLGKRSRFAQFSGPQSNFVVAPDNYFDLARTHVGALKAHTFDDAIPPDASLGIGDVEKWLATHDARRHTRAPQIAQPC